MGLGSDWIELGWVGWDWAWSGGGDELARTVMTQARHSPKNVE